MFRGRWATPALTTRDKLGLTVAAIGLLDAGAAQDASGLFLGVVGLGIVVWPRRRKVAAATQRLARLIVSPPPATVSAVATVTRDLTRSRSYTAPVSSRASVRAVLRRADGTVLIRGDN